MITEFSHPIGKGRIDISSFTKDQVKAYNGLIDFINKPYDENDSRRALIGAAGTGKTYLVKALIENCSLSYSLIGLSAPTHKACRVLNESINLPNLKSNTLQSDLGLKLNFNIDNFDINRPPFDPRGRIKIGDYSLYIVDEASMIPQGLKIFLENTCKSNQCKIIYIGDATQLAPVGELYSSAFKGVTSYTLNEIVRQNEDNPIRPLLDMLRYDVNHKTFSFLNYIIRNKSKFNDDNTMGYAVCTPNEFQQMVYNNFSDEELTQNTDYAKIIAFTNNCVSNWNKFIRHIIIKDAEKSVITVNDLILSYTTIVNQFNSCVIKNSEDYILKEVVNYTHPKYDIKGFLVKFIAIHGGTTTSPLFVIDHADPNSIMNYINTSNRMINEAKTASSSIRSNKWKEFYEFKETCLLLADIIKPNGDILFKRDLDYGFALTAHKSQGSTFDTVLVDVNDIVYNKYGQPYSNAEEINRRLYVACSRAKNKLYLKYGN